MIPSSAYLLVSHGSRDPRPQQSLDRVIETMTAQVHRSDCWFAAGVLECSEQPLQDRIVEVAEQAIQLGLSSLTVVPLFLLPGVHVMEDIPTQVAAAQTRLGSFAIAVLPYLGQSDVLGNLVKFQVQHAGSSSQRILLSHGSRRSGGNQPVEQLAQQIGALPAYWSVEPKVTTGVAAAIAQVRSSSLPDSPVEIDIIPYFLFPGGITDAIAAQVTEMIPHFPDVKFHWWDTLDANPNFAEAILKHIYLSALN